MAAHVLNLAVLSIISLGLARAASLCDARGQAGPSWNVSEWYSDFSDPTQGETIIFVLRNNENDYTTMCFDRGGPGQCFWIEREGAPPRDDSIDTDYVLDRDRDQLEIVQTWTCDDANSTLVLVPPPNWSWRR